MPRISVIQWDSSVARIHQFDYHRHPQPFQRPVSVKDGHCMPRASNPPRHTFSHQVARPHSIRQYIDLVRVIRDFDHVGHFVQPASQSVDAGLFHVFQFVEIWIFVYQNHILIKWKIVYVTLQASFEIICSTKKGTLPVEYAIHVVFVVVVAVVSWLLRSTASVKPSNPPILRYFCQ